MERLTKRFDGCVSGKDCPGYCRTYNWVDCTDIYPMLDKIAAYEDTGLEPEQINTLCTMSERAKIADLLRLEDYQKLCSIDHIRELVKAEKDGRLVVLPCKVGDTVWTNFAMSGWYFRDKDKPYSARVVFVGLNDSDVMGRGIINVVYGKNNYMMQFSLSDIGKTVFLNREEAVDALKKMEETDDEAVR